MVSMITSGTCRSMSCTNTLRSEPVSSWSTYSLTIPQLVKAISSGWLVGRPAGLQVDGGLRQPTDLGAAADQRDPPAVAGGAHELGDRFGVGAAQHRVRRDRKPHCGVDVVGAAEPQRRLEDLE